MSTTARVLRSMTIGVAAAAGYALARQRALRLGATQVERSVGLAGDELLPDADLVATRAITIQAPAASVYPWLLQLGTGRGGFYSGDLVERICGGQVRSADRIVPAWQDLAVGDRIRFTGRLSFSVARLDPDHAVVMRSHGGATPPGASGPMDVVWSFVLRPGELVGSTRLIVRERYGHLAGCARWVAESGSWVSTAMTWTMLHGIRDRVELHR